MPASIPSGRSALPRQSFFNPGFDPTSDRIHGYSVSGASLRQIFSLISGSFYCASFRAVFLTFFEEVGRWGLRVSKIWRKARFAIRRRQAPLHLRPNHFKPVRSPHVAVASHAANRLRFVRVNSEFSTTASATRKRSTSSDHFGPITSGRSLRAITCVAARENTAASSPNSFCQTTGAVPLAPGESCF